MSRRLGWMLALLLAGCTTSGSTTYRHPITGDQKVCMWREPNVVTEAFCPPCYYSMRDKGYAACRDGLEAQGYTMEMRPQE